VAQTAEAGEDVKMSEAPEATQAEPEAKRGDAAWKEHRDAVSDRNAQARKRGSAERKVALGRVTEQRRVNARREAEQLHMINAKLSKARPRG
jgi:hypothetical protein